MPKGSFCCLVVCAACGRHSDEIMAKDPEQWREAVAAIEPVKVALCVRAYLAGIKKRSDLIAKLKAEAKAKEQYSPKR